MIEPDLTFVGPIVVLLCLCLTRYFLRRGEVASKCKAVLITGCDNEGSFGQLSAEALAKRGFRVFATCVTQRGCYSIVKLSEKVAFDSSTKSTDVGQITPIILNITDANSVKSAVRNLKDILRDDQLSLWALVNNAGIHDGLFIDWTSLDVFKQLMEVNFFGMVRVTKEILPLLKKSRGRVINLTSLDGYRPLPTIAAYTSSKHAAEAFTSCLRWEMKLFGVSVHSINPGTFKTAIVTGGAQRIEDLWKTTSPDCQTEYGERFAKKIMSYTHTFTSNASTKTSLVVNAVMHATCSAYPCRRYFPGYDAKFLWKPLWDLVPEFVMDTIIDTFLKIALPPPAAIS